MNRVVARLLQIAAKMSACLASKRSMIDEEKMVTKPQTVYIAPLSIATCCAYRLRSCVILSRAGANIAISRLTKNVA